MADKCSKCGADIIWLRHKTSDKPAPIEAAPSSFGNILVKGDQYRVATNDEIKLAKEKGINLFLNHFAGCVYAQSFRKDK